MACDARYDTIGHRYADFRRPDPTWEVEIWAALGSAERVLNVGAGPGSYEPTDRSVLALEPSITMIEQRGAHAAPVVQGVAEALPFADDSFDVAMGVLTMHHWSDPHQGLRELARVAPRQVLTVYEPERAHKMWLVDYFEAALGSPIEVDPPTPATIAETLDVVDVRPLWVTHDCHEGFAAAYWRRPERYLDPGVQGSISVIAMLTPSQIKDGTDRLRADIDSGAWHDKHGQHLPTDRADFGYRLVMAERR